MTQFGVVPSSSGPLARKLASHMRPALTPEPVKPKIVSAVESEARRLQAIADGIDGDPVLKRQAMLVILQKSYGAQAAADALGTIVESVYAAHDVFAPIIARRALIVVPTAESFLEIFTSATTCESSAQVYTLRELLHISADAFQVTIAQIKSHRRNQREVRPRHVFCFLGRKFSTASYPQIGNFIGGRDHTSALHGATNVQMIVQTLGIETESPRDVAAALAGAPEKAWKR